MRFVINPYNGGGTTEKGASTALVRRILKGTLSPKTITRAATAMPAGKFRFLNHLGEGQFNLADKVVGNVGGYSGVMARKLPNRYNPSYVEDGKSLKNIIDRFNSRMEHRRFGGTPGQTPLIAPIIESNPKGVFQQLSTGNVPMKTYTRKELSNIDVRLPYSRMHFTQANPRQMRAVNRNFMDLHQGNYGVRGQIHDAQPRLANPLFNSPIAEQFKSPIIGGRSGWTNVLDANRSAKLTRQIAVRNAYSDKALSLPAAARFALDIARNSSAAGKSNSIVTWLKNLLRNFFARKQK